MYYRNVLSVNIGTVGEPQKKAGYTMVKIFALSEGESARGEGNIYSVSSLDERVEEAMHAFCIALAGDNDDEEGEVVG